MVSCYPWNDPWNYLPHSFITPISPCFLKWLSSVWVCLSKFPLPNLSTLIKEVLFTWLHLGRLFPNKVTFMGTRDYDFNISFLETQIKSQYALSPSCPSFLFLLKWDFLLLLSLKLQSPRCVYTLLATPLSLLAGTFFAVKPLKFVGPRTWSWASSLESWCFS